MDCAHVLKQLKKEHGDDIGGVGMKLPPMERLPFGLLAVDIATGGGIPLNRMTLIYGAESSGKTLLVMCLIREWQLRYPDRKVVLVEPEGTFDTDWAAECGVDVDSLIIFRPEHIEQAADIMVAMLGADDVGLLVLDSVAAAASMVEMEKTAEQVIVGGNSKQINALCRRAQSKFNRAQKEGRDLTMVWINQTRTATGVMFGSPETLPGGKGQGFFASMKLRLYGKKKMVPEAHSTIPSLLDLSGTVAKAKCGMGAQNFKLDVVLRKHKGLLPGRGNDWPVFKQYAMDMGLLSKGKGCWELVDPLDGTVTEYPTQVALFDTLRADVVKWDRIRNAIIAKVME